MAEGQGKRKATPRRTHAEAHLCQDRAYRLKVDGGMSFDAIAKTPDPTHKLGQLYANASAARVAYLAGAQRVRGTEKESPLSVTERRALQDDRYERLIQAWMPKALGGSGEATDRILRALNQQADLHGLKTKASVPEVEDGGQEDVADELATRRERARQDAAAALRGAAPGPPAPPTRG